MNIEKRREIWRNWYLRNRESVIEKNRKYNLTKKGKESAIRRANAQRKKNPEKWKARQTLRNAIYRKKIIRQPCEVCGDIKSQGHHEDYSKPLEVVWLCQKHHDEKHTSSVSLPL